MTIPTNPHPPRRRSIRLPGWDYRTHAFYFVTICTLRRETLLLNVEWAELAANLWGLIPTRPHARGVILDEWVVMPNHVHGLLLLPGPAEARDDDAAVIMPSLPFDMRYAGGLGARPAVEPDHTTPLLPGGSLGAVVGNYKSGVTRRVNQLRHTPGGRFWQRGYYEHIVRNHHELDRIRAYICENPARWADNHDNLDTLVDHMVYQEAEV